MKTKRTDWLLRTSFLNKESHRIINLEELYDMTYKEVLKMVKEISFIGCTIRIYEFKDGLSFGNQKSNPKEPCISAKKGNVINGKNS